MKVTAEQVREAYEKEVPDLKTCLHHWRSAIVELPGDDENSTRYGVIVRTISHDIDGNLITHDILINARTLAEISQDVENAMRDIFVISMPDPDELAATLAREFEGSVSDHDMQVLADVLRAGLENARQGRKAHDDTSDGNPPDVRS